MEWLRCKACGCQAVFSVEVVVAMDDGSLLQDGEVGPDALEEYAALDESESRLYTCHVCGDNWLSIKETADSESCQITFIHQMGIAPMLRRVAHMQTPIVLKESTVDSWEYFLDDHPIDEEVWLDQLRERREALRSACVN